jgi:DNA-directed RNA polymerase subunit omega
MEIPVVLGAFWGDTTPSLSAAISRESYPGVNPSSAADARLPLIYMNANLVKAANEVVPNQQILVNMISRRVRQLALGHRPLVENTIGLREADIALTEIATGKLTYESTFGLNGNGKGGDPAPASPVLPFPAPAKAKKKAA